LTTPVTTTLTEVELPEVLSGTAVGVVIVTVASELLSTTVDAATAPPLFTLTVYADAADGNTVPAGAANVIVPVPAANAPVELGVKTTVYCADSPEPSVAIGILGPVTMVTLLSIV
jgi:hypothetical protein